jgi:hypothetical protein
MVQSHRSLALIAQAKLREKNEALGLLNEAVNACREALCVYTRENSSWDWAATNHNLGLAMAAQAELSEASKAINLWNTAIAAYRSALEVLTPEDYPHPHNTVKKDLAAAESVLKGLQAKGDAVPAV